MTKQGLPKRAGASCRGGILAVVNRTSALARRLLFAGAVSAVSLSVAVAEERALLADEAFVAQPPPGLSVTAGMMKLSNPHNRPVHVLAASSEQLERIEIHQTTIVNDVASMVEVERVTVPAGGTVFFRHGGFHLMMFGPVAPLAPGDCIPVTIETSMGNIAIGFEVIKQGMASRHKESHAEGHDSMRTEMGSDPKKSVSTGDHMTHNKMNAMAMMGCQP